MSILRPQVSKIDYASTLGDLWTAHLEVRDPLAPTVISTFAGCGGSSLGYSAAGYRELLAVEFDKHAVKTFEANFPDVPVYAGDIAGLTVDQCKELAGIEEGELDVFDGSPPCQGFSTAGKRKFEDSRNQLFREYVRLLDGLQPKKFVMENVSGMVKGKMKLVFAEILGTLKSCGYRVTAKLLNAKFYGVPQARQRMIFIGVRNDLDAKPSFPPGARDIVTAEEALNGIEPEVRIAASAKMHGLWLQARPGENFQGYDKKGHCWGSKRIASFKPSPTVTKIVYANGSGAGLYHWDEPRLLSINEIKRLGSFPDQFKLEGRFAEQWARIGNSVPPLMMRAIAEHIKLGNG